MSLFTIKFTLSREYLAECFDQSLPYSKHAKPNYIFPALLFAVGISLLSFTAQPKVMGMLFIALGVLELVHIRFRRAWWLARQMWSRSANSEVTLTLDEKGVQTQTPFTTSTLLWADLEHVIETKQGLILVAQSGSQQYLSKSLFSSELIAEILAKPQTTPA